MFKEGTCPKCHEKIQVPDDRESILCMFCGQTIRVDEALGIKKKIDDTAYQENYDCAMAGFQDIIQKCDNPIQSFRKDSYKAIFQSFCNHNLKTFEAAEVVYQNEKIPEEWIWKLVDKCIETAKNDLATYKFKGSRNQHLLDFNLLISVYLIPAILNYPADFSTPFTDCLIKKWNDEFHTNVGKATYEDIDSGFRRKLCYITTVVCKGLGKESNCYELQILKDYRDRYLEPTEEGRAIVDEYYNIAPTIVKRLEKQPEKDMIYQGIYQKYLLPCIQKIETHEYEACREIYQEMVLDLKATYMNCIPPTEN